MSKERWNGISASELDGYTLFERLDDGDPVEVRVKGKVYRLQFEGSRYGGDNKLVVTCGTETRWYGRGWESVQVFEAIEEMERGWEQPQTHRFKAMDGVSNVEAL